MTIEEYISAVRALLDQIASDIGTKANDQALLDIIEKRQPGECGTVQYIIHDGLNQGIYALCDADAADILAKSKATVEARIASIDAEIAANLDKIYKLRPN